MAAGCHVEALPDEDELHLAIRIGEHELAGDVASTLDDDAGSVEDLQGALKEIIEEESERRARREDVLNRHALLRGRQGICDAITSIRTLEKEINARASLQVDRRDGNRAGPHDQDGQPRGPKVFKQVQERLNLSPEQSRAFRTFLKQRRDSRRNFVDGMAASEEALRAALLGETLDLERVIALREEIDAQQRDYNRAAFMEMVALVETLSQEQREAMLEMARGRPNSLLFL